MRKSFPLFCSFILLLLALAPVSLAAGAKPLRVLVVTGGHAYETNEFAAMFWSIPEISVRSVAQPEAQSLFTEEAAAGYDLMVWYDMWQPISEGAKKDLLARIREGKGLVALHHSIASYQDWPEYLELIGGRYHLQGWKLDGVEKPGSVYQHDVLVPVTVATDHPVTAGLEDFTIHDETYGGLQVLPSSQVLLTTDEPTSTPQLAWAHSFGEGRVVCLQLGHDHLAYENPSYRRLLAQAIRWVGPQD